MESIYTNMNTTYPESGLKYRWFSTLSCSFKAIMTKSSAAGALNSTLDTIFIEI